MRTLTRFTWLFLVVVFFAGCHYRLVAPFDEKTEEAIFNSAKMVDLFYANLLNTDETARQYAKFSQRYLEIEAELNALVLRNKVRSLNEESTEIAEKIVGLWRKYKERHKASDGYPTAKAETHRDRFARMFSYALKAEGAKKTDQEED